MPGSVCVLPYSVGSLDGWNTSPAIRTVTWLVGAVPAVTVAVSPTARPLAVRNAVLTSTSPGASYQCPAMMPKSIQEASPPNAWAFTLCATPGTLTSSVYTATSCCVPGWARSTAVTAAFWAASGDCCGPAPGLTCWICTGAVAEWVWLAAARLSAEFSPIAKITAVAPNAIAARVTAVRAGRANGAARPRPAGRGRRSRAASRCAAARPASRSCPNGWPPNCTGTVAAGNGPAAAVTPPRVPVAASSAELARAAFRVTVTSAPCWAPNACWNGALLAASSVKPSVAEAVETSSTMPITTACTLCRSNPPVAVLIAPSQFIVGQLMLCLPLVPPQPRRPAGRPRAVPCEPRTARPAPGRG